MSVNATGLSWQRDARSVRWLLYIGADKAGSTWFHRHLGRHPEVYLAPAKDTEFFTEHFRRGMRWYWGRFRGATVEQVVGEVSHNYLYSDAALFRIRRTLGSQVRLLVSLRAPVERTLSAFQYLKAKGLARADFWSTCWEFPELLTHSLYASRLRMLFTLFPESAICVIRFEDISCTPQDVLQRVFDFLEVADIKLSDIEERVLPASEPRCRAMSRVVTSGASVLRDLGFVDLVGRLKANAAIRKALYRPVRRGSTDVEARLRRQLSEWFAADVEDLANIVGAAFVEPWQQYE